MSAVSRSVLRGAAWVTAAVTAVTTLGAVSAAADDATERPRPQITREVVEGQDNTFNFDLKAK